MKLSYKVLALSAAIVGGALSSCASFLDVVPDENVTDRDTYSGRGRGEGYLYSCYAYMPNHASTVGGLDRMTGDETVTAFEHELFASFLKGNYTASSPVISYWNTLFEGIRRCYMFKERIDKLPEDVTAAEKVDMHAQADFLIGYYHFLLFRSYGPTIIVRQTPDINQQVADFPEREKLDDCVAFIVAQFDKAAANLPATRMGTDGAFQGQRYYGLATSVAAKALKAKTLVYAASPLFNGGLGDAYKDLTNMAGEPLMPLVPDPSKWVTAKTAVEEAIAAAEAAGHSLYSDESAWGTNTYPVAGVERKMRSLLLDWRQANPEALFVDTRGEGFYDIQLKSLPRNMQKNHGANGVSLTWAMISRFYTEDGLPWDEDPKTKNLVKTDVVAIPAGYENRGKVGEQTVQFNIFREPRFYAWVGFHNGYYEVRRENANIYSDAVMPQNGRVLLKMLKGEHNGRQLTGPGSSNNYSPGGYLNKKGVNPNTMMKSNNADYIYYPFMVMRLADLYLLHAEAAVETGDFVTAKAELNKVRLRAGIPTVQDSWDRTGINIDNTEKMRAIVQQERQIELYLENQNFWDMRRWLRAEETFSRKSQGLNVEGTTIQEYARVVDINYERKFEAPKNYLMPIPSADINRNTKIKQNPGY